MTGKLTYRELHTIPEDILASAFSRQRAAAGVQRRDYKPELEHHSRLEQVRASPVKMGVFRDGKLIGFASGRIIDRHNSTEFGALRVNAVHVEGHDPKVGIRLLGRMAVKAEGMSAKHLVMPHAPHWIEGAMEAEGMKLKQRSTPHRIIKSIHHHINTPAHSLHSWEIRIGTRSASHHVK